MWLLNTDTLELQLFHSAEDAPPYAILSHTWGSDEVLFEDARHGKDRLKACGKKELDKVLTSASEARRNGYDYIWIDTCCIDKSSSAELSEAINSMFSWYQLSAVCYAFLADYVHTRDTLSDSRWFTRGWTLQELIAPSDVRFYDGEWVNFGDRGRLSRRIKKITGIDKRALCREENDDVYAILNSYSISARMSWASLRETTRTEDIAYCLLGIFNINMPLLYGEGSNAFQRLQEEIVRRYNDQTLLIWKNVSRDSLPLPHGNQVFARNKLFALHPSMFWQGYQFQPISSLLEDHTISISSDGLELDAYIVPCTTTRDGDSEVDESHWLAVLSCSRVEDDLSCAAIRLKKTNRTIASFIRSYDSQHVDGPIIINEKASCVELSINPWLPPGIRRC
jgi:hypothetical protein